MKTKVIDNELCGTLEVIAGGGVPEMNASSALSSVQANNNDPNNSDFLGQVCYIFSFVYLLFCINLNRILTHYIESIL